MPKSRKRKLSNDLLRHPHKKGNLARARRKMAQIEQEINHLDMMISADNGKGVTHFLKGELDG